MNSTLEDVTQLGWRFTKNIKAAEPIGLGTVLSFLFDDTRMLHMIICHNIGFGGWSEADKYLRIGLDYLWQTDKNNEKR